MTKNDSFRSHRILSLCARGRLKRAKKAIRALLETPRPDLFEDVLEHEKQNEDHTFKDYLERTGESLNLPKLERASCLIQNYVFLMIIDSAAPAKGADRILNLFPAGGRGKTKFGGSKWFSKGCFDTTFLEDWLTLNITKTGSIA